LNQSITENVEMSTTLQEDCIRDIIGDFVTNKNLVYHQVDSFNNYVTNGIQQVIDEEPPIVVKLPKGKQYRVKFGEVYIPKASLVEENRKIVLLTPHEARTKNLNYDTPVYVDVTEETFEDGKLVESVFHKRFNMFRQPVMRGSCLCNTFGATDDELIAMGECLDDLDGMFIIKGNERVLVGQLRARHDHVMVYKQKPSEKFKYIAEIRSMSEETGHSVLVQAKIGSDNRTLCFSLPYIKEPVAIGIVFKAFGYEEDILKLIGMSNITKAREYLRLIIRDCFFIKTQAEALKFIGERSLHTIQESKHSAYAWQVIETELFPHLGITATIKEKAMFLGHMVNKLLSTSIGLRSPDDRDNFANKRVDDAGTLCRDLFRTLFKKYCKTIEKIFSKKNKRLSIMPVITRQTSITLGLKYCFGTGNWGAQKNAYIRTGVSQLVSRLTFPATLSHLRRLVIPIGKEGKNAKIRAIHTSSYGFICPVETPEGPSAGIVLNYAYCTRVTKRIPTILVRETLERLESIILINDLEVDCIADGTFVFLNGIVIGFSDEPDDVVEEVKTQREAGYLDWSVSVTYDSIDNEVRIYSDDGRLARPLFSINHATNKVNALDCESRVWDELLEKKVIQYIDASEIENCEIAMKQEDIMNRKDYCEIHPAIMMGILGSAIPFPDHSQAPRNIFQSNMGKQAIGVYASNFQIRTDTIAYVLDYAQKPLVSTWFSEMMGFNRLPTGINAIVAVAVKDGKNQEDSLIINKRSKDLGLFSVTSYRTISEEEKKRSTYITESIMLPLKEKQRQGSNYSLLDSRGIVRRGVNVKKGDIIIGKMIIKNSKDGLEEYTDCSVRVKHGEEGTVDRIVYTVTPNGYRLVKVVIRRVRIPEVGDKFASRAAQKGTCGEVCPYEDMPWTADGITPDIIINPHCVPSRMTINQLMENVTGKACAMDGTYGDATAFSESSSGAAAESICDRLAASGFERHGWERMRSGVTGELIEAQIFIGPTYYQRLNHLVSNKIHSRAQGHVTMLTRQPLEGAVNPYITWSTFKIEMFSLLKVDQVNIRAFSPSGA
jgi:DNA-directed RNA polymerase II subunit RPB2